MVNHDGTGLTRITSNDAACTHPSWSPDGAWLVVARKLPSGANTSWDLWIMKPNGSSLTNVTNAPTSDEHSPAWR